MARGTIRLKTARNPPRMQFSGFSAIIAATPPVRLTFDNEIGTQLVPRALVIRSTGRLLPNLNSAPDPINRPA